MNEIHDDYPPAGPAEWAHADEARAKRPAGGFGNGGGRGAKRRRGGGRGRTYIAIIALLLVLIGGFYWAYVNNLIDIPAIGSLKSGGGGGGAAASTGKDKVVFSGNARELASPNGNLVQQDKADPAVTWIRSSLRAANASGATEGASLQIKPALATDLVGKRVELIVSARAPDQGTPTPFAIAYSAENVATSGWVVFTPTKEFADYSFDFQVPSTVGAAQYVGIWSDISGRGAPLAIRSITIRRLN